MPLFKVHPTNKRQTPEAGDEAEDEDDQCSSWPVFDEVSEKEFERTRMFGGGKLPDGQGGADAESSEERSCWSDERSRFFTRWLLRLPIINYVYLIVDSVPTFESIKELLNIIGLVAALVFSVAACAHGLVSYEDIAAAEARCLHADPESLSLSGQPETLSTALNEHAAMSTLLLSLSIFIVVLLYMSLVTLDLPKGKDVDQPAPHVLRCWYRWASVFILAAIVNLVLGIIYYIDFLVYVTMVTIHSPAEATVPCVKAIQGFAAIAYLSDPEGEPHAYLRGAAQVFYLPFVLFTALVLGYVGVACDKLNFISERKSSAVTEETGADETSVEEWLQKHSVEEWLQKHKLANLISHFEKRRIDMEVYATMHARFSHVNISRDLGLIWIKVDRGLLAGAAENGRETLSSARPGTRR